MQQIGLYVHRVRIFEDYNRLELGDRPGQFNLRQFVQEFVNFYQTNFISGEDRLSKLDNIIGTDISVSGLIRYGITGIASDIVDAETNELRLRRERDNVEIIPLYFCFFAPPGEDTWYMVTQSFGGRSCSSAFNRAFRDFISDRTNCSVMVQKVMPMNPDEMVGRGVQKLTLIRRHVPGDEFENQIGDLAQELKVSMSISVHGRGTLGLYENIRDKLADREDVALVHDGIEFDELQATVRVGNSYRKVGMIGANNSAGVVDVSDDVERDDDEYPMFASIDQVALQLCHDYLIAFRDQ